MMRVRVGAIPAERGDWGMDTSRRGRRSICVSRPLRRRNQSLPDRRFRMSVKTQARTATAAAAASGSEWAASGRPRVHNHPCIGRSHNGRTSRTRQRAQTMSSFHRGQRAPGSSSHGEHPLPRSRVVDFPIARPQVHRPRYRGNNRACKSPRRLVRRQGAACVRGNLCDLSVCFDKHHHRGIDRPRPSRRRIRGARSGRGCRCLFRPRRGGIQRPR